jgi:hypothetical protein
MQIQTPEVVPTVTPQSDPAPETPAMIAREEFERVQSDMHKFKQLAKDADARVEKLKMQGLKEKDDWKNVAQEYETKYAEAVKERDGIRQAIVTDKKMSAIKLEAKKAGILDSALEDLELIDFPEVSVETTSTGKVNVLGVERAVQRLKTTRSHWFGKQTPNVNSGSPDVTTGNKISYEDVMKSEQEARKSGKWHAHGELLARYRTQK